MFVLAIKTLKERGLIFRRVLVIKAKGPGLIITYTDHR